VGDGAESVVAAAAALLDSDAEAAARGSAGSANGALTRANGEALESGAQLSPDNGLLTRSRADWLRGGVGSEASPQALGTDVQPDDLIDTPRPMLAARAEAAPPSTLTPLASSIAGMAPATASGAAPTTSAAQAGQHLFPEYALNHAPQDPEFPGELTARMKTLLRDGVREARLQLHPAELGRLSVTVSTDGDQARVSFIADTAAARDAIEQSMPRLREMLEQNGLQLAQSDVGQRDLQGGRDGADAERSISRGNVGDTPAESEVPEELVSHRSSSRIDTYI
jgi:flagellar hook-length control protein FliK